MKISLECFEAVRSKVNNETLNEEFLGVLRNGDKLPDPHSEEFVERWCKRKDAARAISMASYVNNAYSRQVNTLFIESWERLIIHCWELAYKNISLGGDWMPFDLLCKNCLTLFELASEAKTPEDGQKILQYATQINNAVAQTHLAIFVNDLTAKAVKATFTTLALNDVSNLLGREACLHMLADAITY